MEFSGAGTYGMSIIVAILSAFVLSGAGAEIDFKDILSCHGALQDYLQIRESSPLYEEVRGTRRLGIPCFVKEDGTMTLELKDVLK